MNLAQYSTAFVHLKHFSRASGTLLSCNRNTALVMQEHCSDNTRAILPLSKSTDLVK